MSSWGNYDNAANAPYWAVSTVSTGVNKAAAAPTAANVALLYGNTTSDVYVTNETVGLFMADKFEVQAADSAIPATGWVLKTTGSGGRAGRVTWEVLACVAEVQNDTAATEDATLVDTTLTFLTSPTAVQYVAGAGNNGSFTVTTDVVPPNASLAYLWQYSTDGTTYATAANGVTANTTYVGNTTGSLTVYATNKDANLYYYRVQVTASNNLANSNTVYTSSNARITLL
jgi:hypothetical protein